MLHLRCSITGTSLWSAKAEGQPLLFFQEKVQMMLTCALLEITFTQLDFQIHSISVPFFLVIPFLHFSQYSLP